MAETSKQITILPAIDLMDNKCVRLRQGRADEQTIYNDDPVDQALQWQAQGAEYLHLVDLDGAFAGSPQHTRVIADIVAAIRIPVEVGGGLRTDDDVRRLLDVGVDRAILGTRAFADTAALRQLVEQHGRHVAVGIDARDGLVQVKGWVETTATEATMLARQVADLGVQTIIYTDTATDGMLKGPNVAAMGAMCAAVPQVAIIASGGVTTADDVRALAALKCVNLQGAIVGKALYDGLTTMTDLLAAAQEGAKR